MSHFASMMQDFIGYMRATRDSLAILHARIVALEAEVNALKKEKTNEHGNP